MAVRPIWAAAAGETGGAERLLKLPASSSGLVTRRFEPTDTLRWLWSPFASAAARRADVGSDLRCSSLLAILLLRPNKPPDVPRRSEDACFAKADDL